MNKSLFITLEGIEGVGKTTALQTIQNYFTERKKPIVITREPGGTAIAESIRQLVLTPNPNESLTKEAELLLMFAGRAQHIAHVIKPALAKGHTVVSDRYVDASFAYQGGGRGIDVFTIQWLEQWIVGSIRPDVTILLDAPPEVGLTRAKHRGPHDRIEQEKIAFFQLVREAYLARAANDPERFHVIDATQTLDMVQSAIKEILKTVS